MDNNKISFPTIGEFVREIFNISGVMAQKDGGNSILTDSDKKRLQTKLKRLADESSKIDGKLEELLNLLGKILINNLKDERFVWVLLTSVEDVLETYKAVLRDDGTYLNKTKSTEWFIKTYALDRFMKSLHKNYLRYNLDASKLDIPPLVSWAIPLFEDDQVLMPLRNAWKLIYESLALSLRDPHEFSPHIQCCNSSYPASVYSGARYCATVLL